MNGSESSVAKSPRTWLGIIVTLVVALVLSLIGVGVLALSLEPQLRSAAEMRVAEGTESFHIDPAGATVMPDAGWSVQQNLQGGLLMRSPDRLLTVTMVAVDAGEAAEAAATYFTDEPLREVFENGAHVHHELADEQFAALVRGPGADTGEAVLILARTEDPQLLPEYQWTLAELLMRVEPDVTRSEGASAAVT